MYLFRVYNGYMGADALSVIVVASDTPAALRLAGEVFRTRGGRRAQPEAYWTQLEAEVLLSGVGGREEAVQEVMGL